MMQAISKSALRALALTISVAGVAGAQAQATATPSPSTGASKIVTRQLPAAVATSTDKDTKQIW